MSALIEFDSVCKYYQMGDTTVKAADHISMQINKGEFVAVAVQAQRIIRLEDGRVVSDGDARAPGAMVQPDLAVRAGKEERS